MEDINKTLEEDREEDELVKRAAEKAGNKAARESLALGLPITILKGTSVIKLYPDGKEELVEELENPFVKITQKKFIIKRVN
ncbi:hypothetical protein CLV51_101650 [Chitinophaga niastensis]|uniref:Uncharacterized protein n=1 Tax=Chitinophaga niastensis TaxID=536980 RepID=A0A2P8HSW3_CHINA|nr:hypothetical protein [Chitinophaga niastensis]PSL49319.1 hypothetical protein CLV51_101650 [Chitinophaga niastensis]